MEENGVVDDKSLEGGGRGVLGLIIGDRWGVNVVAYSLVLIRFGCVDFGDYYSIGGSANVDSGRCDTIGGQW